MTEFVVLSLTEADALFPVDPRTGSRVRETVRGHAICPVALDSGVEFIIPLEVLNDPNHTAIIDALKLHAQRPTDLRSPTKRREVLSQEFKRDGSTGARIEKL